MSIIDEIELAINKFIEKHKVKPIYLVLSNMGNNLLKQSLAEISGNEIAELKAYKGLQVIITGKRDIVFDLL